VHCLLILQVSFIHNAVPRFFACLWLPIMFPALTLFCFKALPVALPTYGSFCRFKHHCIVALRDSQYFHERDPSGTVCIRYICSICVSGCTLHSIRVASWTPTEEQCNAANAFYSFWIAMESARLLRWCQRQLVQVTPAGDFAS